MKKIYYFLKSLIISKDSKSIKNSLKNPKEVMKYIVFIWIVLILLSRQLNLPEYYHYVLFCFLFLTYCWKRKRDGDWKYFYRKATGEWEYKNK